MGAPRAWGKKLPDYSTLSSPRHGLAGAEADEAVGTYSFGARTYDPTLRRWVSPDPLLASLPSIGEGNAETLNLYGYADGNPVKNTDTTGYCPVCAAAAGAIVIIGMGLSAPSDTAQAPADIVGMAASVPGPAVVLGAAEKLLAKAAVAATEKGIPAVGQAIRGLVQGASKGAGAAEHAAGVGESAAPKAASQAEAAARLRANAGAGKDWEKQMVSDLKSEGKQNVQTQITVRTDSGVKTRIDAGYHEQVSPSTVKPRLVDGKASQTAGLTKNQKAAFPEIEKNGCTVCGKGKPGFPGGMRIPPTKVEIRRPPPTKE